MWPSIDFFFASHHHHPVFQYSHTRSRTTNIGIIGQCPISQYHLSVLWYALSLQNTHTHTHTRTYYGLIATQCELSSCHYNFNPNAEFNYFFTTTTVIDVVSRHDMGCGLSLRYHNFGVESVNMGFACMWVFVCALCLLSLGLHFWCLGHFNWSTYFHIPVGFGNFLIIVVCFFPAPPIISFAIISDMNTIRHTPYGHNIILWNEVLPWESYTTT